MFAIGTYSFNTHYQCNDLTFNLIVCLFVQIMCSVIVIINTSTCENENIMATVGKKDIML
jgi:hypothetical protein